MNLLFSTENQNKHVRTRQIKHLSLFGTSTSGFHDTLILFAHNNFVLTKLWLQPRNTHSNTQIHSCRNRWLGEALVVAGRLCFAANNSVWTR